MGITPSDSSNIFWKTPKGDLPFGRSKITLNKLKKAYDLKLDPCCMGKDDAMCEKFYTPEQDGLKMPWNENFIFNPPFAEPVLDEDGQQKTNVDVKTGESKLVFKSVICKWIERAFNQSRKHKVLGIGILPVYSDLDCYHNFIYDVLPSSCIVPIRGRIHYIGVNGESGSPNFPSMLAFWDCRS